ncbi:inactive RHOMBOID-like protein 8 [Rosa rugosa]|uniref:inactive RHOMBOID-like protein 8 n=1 Tax=Rosa rugosa TaxID=74645 RepID=UPI002B40E971|nr:inactive RHOMBOID-like protein 8 [Rosa rugosa]
MAAEPPPSKLHTQIDITAPPPCSADDSSLATETLREQRLSFFASRYTRRRRRRRSDTWIISLFVILHVLAFALTMAVNDCWRKSHGDCALGAFGRLSFQPLRENPLLGPSASTLDEVGALRRTFLTENHKTWRLFTFPCLHAGAIHLVINLCSVVFIGIHLEQEFGTLIAGLIYVLSSFNGTLVAALFVEKRPSVGSSGALYGLLGATLSALIQNWDLYTNKFTALTSVLLVAIGNFLLGLLPYVDNFSNLGGFLSGFLLGSALLSSPQVREVVQGKGGLLDNDLKSSIKSRFRQKLDRPVYRSVCLFLFVLMLAGCLVAVLQGIDMNQYCKWCRYVDCVPSKRWSCSEMEAFCETMVSHEQMTLTCMGNGNFKVLPFTNISQARMNDLCSMICS